ncbi:MAG: Cyclic nucleotide-gated potassium channel [Acidimicrobiales bacterium AG-410-I20]|nr:MAG: Cyclic nucleotide-gated potassium channel [Acidimicrobiales bacterium AG-410-I20]
MICEDTPIALNEIEIFSGLTKQELRSVNRLMATVNVKAGRHLARQGEKGREFMVIRQGEATVNRDGKKLTKLKRGDFFGENSVIADVPRTATVIADTDMVINTMNRQEFSILLDQVPQFARTVLTNTVQRLNQSGDCQS